MNEKGDAAFDTFAGCYEATVDKSLSGTGMQASYFSKYRARYVRAHVHLSASARVLDYGCGTGNLAGELISADPNLHVDGYDPAAKCIDMVPEGVRSRGVFSCDMAEMAPQYDCIVLSMVLHHIGSADRAETLRGVGGLLAPEGQLLIFEHNPRNPLTRRVVGRCPFDRDAELVAPAELDSLLGASGLRRRRLDYLVFLPPPLGRYDHLLSWCRFGAQYAAIAGM